MLFNRLIFLSCDIITHIKKVDYNIWRELWTEELKYKNYLKSEDKNKPEPEREGALDLIREKFNAYGGDFSYLDLHNSFVYSIKNDESLNNYDGYFIGEYILALLLKKYYDGIGFIKKLFGGNVITESGLHKWKGCFLETISLDNLINKDQELSTTFIPINKIDNLINTKSENTIPSFLKDLLKFIGFFGAILFAIFILLLMIILFIYFLNILK